jgi:membrane protein YdbS with pleckstrin-like domain
VKDSTFEQPFLLRIFGLANLQIRTSDPSNPSILIPAIREANAIRESLRRSVETMRERKGVREVDYR